jgi:hypothetical protein
LVENNNKKKINSRKQHRKSRVFQSEKEEGEEDDK